MFMAVYISENIYHRYSCYSHILDLCRLCRFLTSEVAKIIATALVLSKQVNWTFAMASSTMSQIGKLSNKQASGSSGSLARVVRCSPCFGRTYLLKSLRPYATTDQST